MGSGATGRQESEGGGSVHLAELVAMLSLGADLGRGQPLDHCLRQTVIASRMADRLGLSEPDRVAIYYVGLLVSSFCHADAHEQAKWFGDDIRVKADGYAYDVTTLEAFSHLLRSVGAGRRGLARAKVALSFPTSGMREVRAFLSTHSGLARRFAERIGLDRHVTAALGHSYARWDGKGEPAGVGGEAIAIASRVVHVADLAEVFGRDAGALRARELLRKRRGTQLDPALVDLFAAEGERLLDGLDEAASWDRVIAEAPGGGRGVRGAELDSVLEGMGDLIDLKAPQFSGHSRGVARLAEAAARAVGLADAEAVTLRRAGYIHDIGRLGVSNAIWEKPGPLTDGEAERARLHAYLLDRMLARVIGLRSVREVAVRHHERLDGSGYPKGLSGASLGPADRILAAADTYHAMTEPRAHRPARTPDAAATALRAEVRAGRLDADAVDAVLRVAGHHARARKTQPAGLTTREVEVLGLVARGYSNKEVARRIGISPKTVSNHVEHIYGKIGVSSRAAATLFAMQHGMVGSFEPSA